MPNHNAKVMEAAVLATLIGKIGRTSTMLTADIQEAAVNCVAQSIVHRNATPAQQLFDAVGSSQRRDSLVAYFEAHGNLAWTKAKGGAKGGIEFFDTFAMTGKDHAVEWNELTEKRVREAKWQEAKKETTPKSVFDVEAEVDSLIGRLTKKQEQGVEVKNDGLLKALVEATNRYKFEQFVANSTAEEQTAMQANIVLVQARRQAEADAAAKAKAEAPQS